MRMAAPLLSAICASFVASDATDLALAAESAHSDRWIVHEGSGRSPINRRPGNWRSEPKRGERALIAAARLHRPRPAAGLVPGTTIHPAGLLEIG